MKHLNITLYQIIYNVSDRKENIKAFPRAKNALIYIMNEYKLQASSNRVRIDTGNIS